MKPGKLESRDDASEGDALDEDNMVSSGSTSNGMVTSSAEQAYKAANEARHATNGDVDMEDSQEDRNAAPPASQGEYGLTQSHVKQEDKPEVMHCVMLIPEDELEAKLPRFTKILSNEIYSLEHSKLVDMYILTDANSTIYKDAALASVDGDILGSIAPSSKKVVKAAGVKRKAPEPDVATTSTKAKAGLTSALGKAASAASVGSASMSKTASASSSKTSQAPALSRQSSTNNVAAKAKSAQETGPSKNVTDSKTAATAGKAKATPAPSTDEYDYMYDDDDDMMAEIDEVDAKGKASTSGSVAAKTTDAAPKERILKSASGRKTRKVMKKITTKNEKGFRITKEVETDESYSGSDDEDSVAVTSTKPAPKQAEPSSSAASAPPPKETKPDVKPTANELKRKDSGSKPTASSSKPKKALKPGEQTSLGNFFSKPKAKK